MDITCEARCLMTIVPELDWDLCALCQQDTKEPLQCPAEDNRKAAGDGYITLSNNLTRFEKCGYTPCPIELTKLDEGEGIETCLKRNKAKWHKSCNLKCNKKAVERAEKRKNSAEEEMPFKKFTRSVGAATISNACFICDSYTDDQRLHKVETYSVDHKVRLCAFEFQDKTLMAKLSNGDLIAQEAKYHNQCLAQLYKRRTLALKHNNSDGDSIFHSLAFAELIEYIEEKRNENAPSPVLLADLIKMYSTRLHELGATIDSRQHSTRLKHRLLGHFPDLKAYTSGRNVFLAFVKEVGAALENIYDDCSDDEALCLAKAARIIRREMFKCSSTFSGVFTQDCQMESVSKSLFTLVSMILSGPTIDTENKSTKQASLSLSQLIQFNSVKRTTNNAANIRHSKDRESPLPIYIGLKIHALARSRTLIESFHNLGLSVSYDRVLQLSTESTDKANARFHAIQAVVPTGLRSGIFCTSAVDNIDHNTSSTSAQGSFHGTGMSIFQYPTVDNPGKACHDQQHDVTKRNSKAVSELPDFYAVVPPVVPISSAAVVPKQTLAYKVMENTPNCELKKEEIKWLEEVSASSKEDTSHENVSWAAYHSNKMPMNIQKKQSIVSLLPLFTEQTKSVAMVKHAMNMIKRTTDHLNPGQVPVVAADQPIFSVAKEIQWRNAETHGEDHFVVMFGGLHIEMAFLKVLGQWLAGGGWVESIVDADVASSGIAESFLKASHVTRTRRAHQVTICSLHTLLHEAYHQYVHDLPAAAQPLAVDEWCNVQCKTHPTFHFWKITMSLEFLLLMFVRSLREGNFQNYISSLKSIVPWFFALDHPNYARWLPIHLCDMVSLKERHPEIHQAFEEGNFVVNKTANQFSGISLDHAHEQNNALVKGEGGVLGLTESPSALRRWTVGGPEVARMIVEFENAVQNEKVHTTSEKHHDATPAVQRKFLKDVQALTQIMRKSGNPFKDTSSELVVLNSRDIADASVTETMNTIEELGKRKFDEFVTQRIDSRTQMLSDPIKRNKLTLIGTPPKKLKTNLASKVSDLKQDCSLFSRLYIASQSREGNLDEFFLHENQTFPPSLAQYGKMRCTNKSTLLGCLEDVRQNYSSRPMVDAIIIDGAAAVHILTPRDCTDFGSYAQKVFLPFIDSKIQCSALRTDLVWDVYMKDSLKANTREKRGSGARRRVATDTKIPQNWNDFLRNSDNKSELFRFLSHQCMSLQTEKIMVATLDEQIVTNRQEWGELHHIAQCTHEEADTRVILHAVNAKKTGCQKILIQTLDTDVVILSIAAFQIIKPQEFWLEFCPPKHTRFIPIHEIAEALGPQKSIALPIFHSLTGCDTVSGFHGIGKLKAWQLWQTYDDITPTFCALSQAPECITENEFLAVERFVILLYDRTSHLVRVNDARRVLFSHKGRSMENIPPTRAALEEHLKRTVFQGGHIWGQALFPQPTIPDPYNWGWTRDMSNALTPLWTSLPPASQSCMALLSCGCKQGCRGRCKCTTAGLRCTALCKCAADCDNS